MSNELEYQKRPPFYTRICFWLSFALAMILIGGLFYFKHYDSLSKYAPYNSVFYAHWDQNRFWQNQSLTENLAEFLTANNFQLQSFDQAKIKQMSLIINYQGQSFVVVKTSQDVPTADNLSLIKKHLYLLRPNQDQIELASKNSSLVYNDNFKQQQKFFDFSQIHIFAQLDAIDQEQITAWQPLLGNFLDQMPEKNFYARAFLRQNQVWAKIEQPQSAKIERDYVINRLNPYFQVYAQDINLDLINQILDTNSQQDLILHLLGELQPTALEMIWHENYYLLVLQLNTSETSKLKREIQEYLAKNLPDEIEKTLPDKTTMTEIVMNPDKWTWENIEHNNFDQVIAIKEPALEFELYLAQYQGQTIITTHRNLLDQFNQGDLEIKKRLGYKKQPMMYLNLDQLGPIWIYQ